VEENNLSILPCGALHWDRTTPEVADWMRDMRPVANLFTAGCQLREGVSMFGSVTDVQVNVEAQDA
jgi:hypothetical protein